MNKIVPSLAAGAMLFSFSGAASATDLAGQAVSVWQNQSGSTFSINAIDPTSGQLTGTYINRASGTGCQNTPFAATGYILNNVISWSVRWSNNYANCNSVTGWSGYYANGEITTDWNLAYSSGPGIQQGSDTFKQVKQKTQDFIAN